MDPITIGFLVLSLASTGLSIFSQSKANQQAKQEGELATTKQQAENQAQRLNADTDFLRLQAETRDKLDAELTALKEQQQQARQLAQSAMLAAVIILVLLACYQALKKRPRTSINS